MNTANTDRNVAKAMRGSLWVLGLLLLILGAGGVFFPNIMSIAIEIYFGWMMVLAGALWSYYALRLHIRSFSGWLKPVILIAVGVLWLLLPASGIAALTLLIAFYLLIDTFAGFNLAFERRPHRGWLWMLLNGLLSLVLAFLILMGWPETSSFFLGLFVGISLLFDGLSLIMLGASLKQK